MVRALSVGIDWLLDCLRLVAAKADCPQRCPHGVNVLLDALDEHLEPSGGWQPLATLGADDEAHAGLPSLSRAPRVEAELSEGVQALH